MNHAVISLRAVTLDYPVFDAARSFRQNLRSSVGGLIRRDPNTSRGASIRALSELNLDIMNGDRVGLLGPNGAGKSTFLRVLAGGYQPTTGEIIVHGKVSSLLGMGIGIDPDETGYENIITGCLLLGMSRRQIDREIAAIVDFSDLGPYVYMPVRTYSNGMWVRLAFAIATSINPDILLIDEVLGGGDAKFTARAEARITSLMTAASALVLASHANELLKRFCNKGLVLVAGSVRYFGPIDDAVAAYDAWLAEGK